MDVIEMYDNKYITLKMYDKVVLIGLLERASLCVRGEWAQPLPGYCNFISALELPVTILYYPKQGWEFC